MGILLKANDIFWQNFWLVVTSLITAGIAVFILVVEIKNNHDENKIKRYESQLEIVNSDASISLFELDRFLESGNKTIMDDFSLQSSMIKTLYQYLALQKARNNLPEESSNVPDFLQDRNLISKIIKNKGFTEFKKYISENFPDLNLIIEIFDENYEINSDEEKKRYESILGNWIMKYESAKQAKILIGVSESCKRIIAIFYLKNAELKADNRIYFKDAEIIYDISDSDTMRNEVEKEVFSKWTSRNPVLYFNEWAQKNKINGYNEIITFIQKSIEKSKFTNIGHNGLRDIVVVKTNRYNNLFEKNNGD